MTRRHAILTALVAIAAPGCASFEAMQHYRSGSAALDRGDPAVAVVELERAAVLAPDASPVQNHLGIAYERVGRRDDAVRAYERAVALDCDNVAAKTNLAKAKPSAAQP